MSISSSLNAGVMGLSANASKLSVISDNIANSATYGYKRVEADFSSLVITSTGDNYTAGGVRMSSQKLISERGGLVGTNNSTDLAVRGRGMIPVTTEVDVAVNNGDLPLLLQTTGSFRTDVNGYLKSETGLVLMGWPALPDGTIPNFPRDTAAGLEPVRINVNQFAGEPTSEVSIGLNLPAVETKPGGAGATEVLTVEYFDNLGTPETLTFNFTPTVPALPTDPASNEWILEITDSAGVIAPAAPGPGHQWTVTFDPSNAGGGNLLNVVPVGAAPAYDPLNGTVTLNDPVNGQSVLIDLGRPNTSEGLTQLSNSFAPVAITKDGSSPGNIVELDVDGNGFVSALYDTGITQTVYQIPLVDMPNPDGLVPLDDQTYLTSRDSGPYFLWDAGDGPTGDIVNFAREESTTDVANELTEMIKTQRAYSSNAKVIQTVDEMLQETTNIKR